MRKISNYELEIVNALVKYPLSHLSQVIDVHPEDKHYHHIELIHPDAPWKGGGYKVLADRIAHDLDGAVVSLLVLGDSSGRPYEIEIQRFDGNPIQRLPELRAWVPVESDD